MNLAVVVALLLPDEQIMMMTKIMKKPLTLSMDLYYDVVVAVVGVAAAVVGGYMLMSVGAYSNSTAAIAAGVERLIQVHLKDHKVIDLN